MKATTLSAVSDGPNKAWEHSGICLIIVFSYFQSENPFHCFILHRVAPACPLPHPFHSLEFLTGAHILKPSPHILTPWNVNHQDRQSHSSNDPRRLLYAFSLAYEANTAEVISSIEAENHTRHAVPVWG